MDQEYKEILHSAAEKFPNKKLLRTRNVYEPITHENDIEEHLEYPGYSASRSTVSPNNTRQIFGISQ